MAGEERLDEVRRYLVDLAGVIAAPLSLLPEFGHRPKFEGQFVELEGEVFSLAYTERGVESRRKTTTDVDELNYWVMEGVTFSMATDWEVRHRNDSADFRVGLFTKQMELLGQLSERWLDRYRNENGRVLKEVGLA